MRSSYRVTLIVLSIFFAIATSAHAQAVNAPPITLKNVAKVGEVVRLGDGNVYDTAWSTDGRWIGLASAGGLWLYDTRDPTTRRLLPELRGAAYAVAFSPDSQTLLAADSARRLYRWSTADWKLVGTPAIASPGKEDYIQSLNFSRDGKTILAMIGNGSGMSIYLLDARSFKQTNQIVSDGHLTDIATVEMNADGSQAFIGTFEGRFWLYNLLEKPAQPLRAYYQPDLGVTLTSTYTTDYRRAFTVTRGGLRLWDLNGHGTTLRFLDAENILTVGITPDKSRLVIAVAGAKSVELISYDLPNGNEIGRLAIQGQSALQLRFSADSKRVLVSTDTDGLQIYNLETGLAEQVFPYHGLFIKSQAFRPDGKMLAVTTTTGSVTLWSLPDGAFLGAIDAEVPYVDLIQFSPNGKTLAIGTYSNTSNDIPSHRITFVDVESRTIRTRTAIHDFEIISLMFAPDGERLFTADVGGSIYEWEVALGQWLSRQEVGKEFTRYIQFLQDGDHYVFSRGTGLELGSISQKKVIASLIPKEKDFTLAALSPQQKLITLRYQTYSVAVFDASSAEQARFPIKSYLSSLQFIAQDDRLLLTTDTEGHLQFWDWKAKKAIKSIEVSSSFVNEPLQSADGSLISAGLSSGVVVILSAK